VAFLTKSTQFCLEKRVLGLSYKPYHLPPPIEPFTGARVEREKKGKDARIN